MHRGVRCNAPARARAYGAVMAERGEACVRGNALRSLPADLWSKDLPILATAEKEKVLRSRRYFACGARYTDGRACSGATADGPSGREAAAAGWRGRATCWHQIQKLVSPRNFSG